MVFDHVFARRLAALAVTAILLVGCDSSKAPWDLGSALTKTSVNDRAFVFKAKRANAGTTVRFRGRHFYAPFRIEGTLGAGSSKRPDFSPGVLGLSLIAADFISPGFYSVEVSSTGDGLSVRAASSSELGTLEFPGSGEVDVAIDHDGTTVTIYARANGSAPFQEVGSVAAVTSGPLVVSLDARDLPKGARVAWDDLRVPLATAPPGADAQLAHTTHLAIDRLLDAYAASDAGGPDLPGARVALESARAHVEDATENAGAGPKKLAARLRTTRKKIDRAISAIDKGKSSRRIAAKVFGAGKAAYKAAALLSR